MNSKRLLLAIFLCAFSYVSFAQTTYYVNNTTGNNSNPGTLSLPFKTIQKSVNVASAGATVYVMAGTYIENIIMNSNSGTITNPIHFKNYNNDVVLIDGKGTNANSGDALWSITDVDNIIIDGFVFQNIINLWVKGLIINKNCNNITITNNTIREVHFSNDPNESVEYSENASPLLVYSTDPANPVTNVVFSNNEIYNCRTGYSESMTLNGNVDGFLLENNYIHDVANIGIDIAGHFGACSDPAFDQARNGTVRGNVLHNCASNVAIAGSIYVDGGKNTIIENNTVYDGQVGIAVGCENPGKTADNIIVRNNITYNNTETGIEIGGYDYPTVSGKVTNSEIYGNTCYKNDTGNNWVGELWVNYVENLTVRNNIFYADNINKVLFYYADNNGAGNTFNYNVFNTPTGATDCLFSYNGEGYGSFDWYKSQTGTDLNSTFADPLFLDATNQDFHLLSNSPAIDAGDPTYMVGNNEKDMDNENRINSGTIDCGADEYYGTLSNKEYSALQIEVYPNPTTDIVLVPNTFVNSNYHVYTMLGQSVKTGAINNNKTIDFSSLKSGLYVIKLEANGSQYTTRVIKE